MGVDNLVINNDNFLADKISDTYYSRKVTFNSWPLPDCDELENHKKATGHEEVTKFSFADC